MSYLEDEYEQLRSQEVAKYDLDDYKDDYDEIEEEGEKF